MRKILLTIGLLVLTTPVLAAGSETVENGVTVVRGSSDYPVREEVLKEEKPVINEHARFFQEYDLWRARVIYRKLNPRP